MLKRNIPVCIILTIITCGIYGWYWFVCLTNETNTLSHHEEDAPGGVALILSIITCNIYGIYWAYKMGTKLDQAKVDHGLLASSSGVVYLILQLFGLQIIGLALMQNEINTLIGKQ